MAGLACARELARADVSVTVFEKSRGLGGRLATRREGNLAWDLGAQFLTARSPVFRRLIEAGERAGTIARWRPRIREDERHWDEPVEEWLVGAPGMSAVVRPLSRNLEIRSGVGVRELLAGQRGWELLTDAGTPSDVFDAVAVAAPAPQALALLAPHGHGFHRISDVHMAPCWVAMMAFDAPLATGADVHRFSGGPLSWAACDSSKPQRPEGAQCWVVHASVAWSRAHLVDDAAEVALQLWQAFAAASGLGAPRPRWLRAHRWRHALVEQPLGQPCIVVQESGAGACGDWCLAPRVEAAFDSGRALAHALLSVVGRSTPSMLR
jgi:hypothetical protein